MNRGGWREGPKRGTKRGKKEYGRLRNAKRAAARVKHMEGDARDQRLDMIQARIQDVHVVHNTLFALLCCGIFLGKEKGERRKERSKQKEVWGEKRREYVFFDTH